MNAFQYLKLCQITGLLLFQRCNTCPQIGFQSGNLRFKTFDLFQQCGLISIMFENRFIEFGLQSIDLSLQSSSFCIDFTSQLSTEIVDFRNHFCPDNRYIFSRTSPADNKRVADLSDIFFFTVAAQSQSIRPGNNRECEVQYRLFRFRVIAVFVVVMRCCSCKCRAAGIFERQCYCNIFTAFESYSPDGCLMPDTGSRKVKSNGFAGYTGFIDDFGSEAFASGHKEKCQ